MANKVRAYWIWIDDKPGTPPHALHAEIEKHPGFMLGRSTGTWRSAQRYLRNYMKAGFICRVYEEYEVRGGTTGHDQAGA